METVALVLIKTELGMAKQVANAATELDSVAWAIVVTGPFDVIAAVRVPDNESLGDLVIDQIQKVDGIKNPTTLVGTYLSVGHGGFP